MMKPNVAFKTMKSETGYTTNEHYTDVTERYSKYNKSDYTMAKYLVWAGFQIIDAPTTFAKKTQKIDDLRQFQEETFQVYAHLMQIHDEFTEITSLKSGEIYEIISYFSPGRDKPTNMINWETCLLATICCGSAPTEEEFNESDYDALINSVIKKRMIPLVYLLLMVIQNKGPFKICKGVRESTKCKGTKKFFEHYLYITKYTDEELFKFKESYELSLLSHTERMIIYRAEWAQELVRCKEKYGDDYEFEPLPGRHCRS